MSGAERGAHGLRLAIWGAVAICFLGLGALAAAEWHSAEPETASAAHQTGSQFRLVDRDGRPVTPETLKGMPYAIFFGFTRCPDVCPTTLSRMASYRKKLGADGEQFRIVFVSVDSGHDTPADVGAYVDLFGTPILGLTGSDAQIADAARSFHVFYQKVPIEGSDDYTIDHSAFVILMDRHGRLKTILSDQDSEDVALGALRDLVA